MFIEVVAKGVDDVGGIARGRPGGNSGFNVVWEGFPAILLNCLNNLGRLKSS